jgi:ATP-dependent Clp protease ATP-binding subunit ClpB
MDEGQLTDSQGKRVDFRSTLLVLTSNLGADALAALPEATPSEQARPQVMEAISRELPPEFVNRLDQIVLFNKLPRAEIRKITALEVSKVSERLEEKDLGFHVSDGAISWLAEAGYDPAYGARPVRRAVRQHVLNPLARTLIGADEAGDEAMHVLVDREAGGGGLRIRVLPESQVEAALQADEWAV